MLGSSKSQIVTPAAPLSAHCPVERGTFLDTTQALLHGVTRNSSLSPRRLFSFSRASCPLCPTQAFRTARHPHSKRAFIRGKVQTDFSSCSIVLVSSLFIEITESLDRNRFGCTVFFVKTNYKLLRNFILSIYLSISI